MGSGNELTEFYDSLSVLYDAIPSETDPEWELALRSVLYGDELLASEASCYGAQQKKRNRGKRERYVRKHGNGDRVTEFLSIAVAAPRQSDLRYVPTGSKLPVAPESEEVLPVKVSSAEVDWAISLLAELPAEPAADNPGDGVNTLLDPKRVRQARANIGENKDTTTILHVSDTHIGYENREKTGRGSTVSWMNDISSHETIDRITQIATERNVDAIVHTGDILDHEVDQETLDTTETFLIALSKADTPIYCIIGSHDHVSANPQHPDSANGIRWLKSQIKKGHLTELSTNPTAIAGSSIDAFGIPAGNVGIQDVGKYQSREWASSDIGFSTASPGPNILCLHDGMTPYRTRDPDIDLNQLLTRSHVSFDLVMVGDEHRPKNEDFQNGYTFQTDNRTPVIYTGPAMRISEPYQDQDAFVTEISITNSDIETTRHLI